MVNGEYNAYPTLRSDGMGFAVGPKCAFTTFWNEMVKKGLITHTNKGIKNHGIPFPPQCLASTGVVFAVVGPEHNIEKDLNLVIKC